MGRDVGGIEVVGLGEVRRSLSFLTGRTFILGSMSLSIFTVWVTWNFSVPFQLKDPSLVGWAVALADVGRLVGALGLVFFPQHLHKQYYMQCAIGVAGSALGMSGAVLEGKPMIAVVFLSLFLIGIGSNPQLVNAMANVEHLEETKLNSIAFSCGRFLCYGSSLLFTLVPFYGGEWRWAMLSASTLIVFLFLVLAKMLLDSMYPHKKMGEDDDSKDSEETPILQNALDAKEQMSKTSPFAWILLLSVSARGNPRSMMVSMGPLVFYQHWGLSHVATSCAYFTPLVLSGLIFPLVSLSLTPKLQLIIINLFLSFTVVVFPFIPRIPLASLDLCLYGVCDATLGSVRVPLLKCIFGDEYKSVTRMVGLQHFVYTLFYGISASYSGFLYEKAHWLPFVVSGAVQLVIGFMLGCVGVGMWGRTKTMAVGSPLEQHPGNGDDSQHVGDMRVESNGSETDSKSE